MTYYTRGYNPQPTQRVGSAELKAEFQLIADGLNAAEAQDGKAIRAEDAIPALPNAISRASKLLSFDGNGKPVTLIAKADIDDAVALAQQKAADATSSADNATAAATAAAQRLAAIEALYDQFDDRYLGAKTTDPTVDNDGNALQAGALYINSASGFIRVYTGSAWVQGISATAGVTAINGQQGALVLPTLNGVPLLGNAGNIVTETQNVLYETRSSNTALAPADKGKLIDLTGGGWTQTLQAAATLGAGWYCYLRYVTQLGPLVDTWNGSFSTDTLWTKGSGWSISGGKANGSSTSAVLTSTASPIIAGRRYRVTYTTSNITLGWIVVGVGGVTDTSRSTNGTYVFEATAITTELLITGTSFTGSVDNITITDLTTTAITVDPNGSELIDGVVSGQLRFGQSILVVCTSTGFVCQSIHTNTLTEFISSGTSWVCPLGVRSVEVTLVGGGNAAPDAYREGAGGVTTIARQAVHPSKTYTYAVGAGGTYAGGTGGTTSFIENSVTLQTSSAAPINGYLASGYKNPTADGYAIGGPSFGGGMGYGRGGSPGGAGSAGGIILRY